MSDARVLVVEVRFHEGRYHGQPEWPPSPARLFQALVAGGARAGRLRDEHEMALRWLERQAPPTIAVPRARRGAQITVYVPNNDLDAKGGNPDEVASLRAPKTVQPRIFEREASLLYAWTLLPDAEDHSDALASLAAELHQLGRGIDAAWARSRVLSQPAFAQWLEAHSGPVVRPTPGSSGDASLLACPTDGTLESLHRRHAATLARFGSTKVGRKNVRVFSQAPKALLRRIEYDGVPHRLVFDLQGPGDRFAAQPLARASTLVEVIRDAAAQRLTVAAPSLANAVERSLIGRTLADHPKLAPEDRVRLIPIPSIGGPDVVPAIRRVLVEVPGNCPLDRADVEWAFAGLRAALATPAPDQETDERAGFVLTAAADSRAMLQRYGIGGSEGRGSGDQEGHTTWRTVTAAALPAERRRLAPGAGESKGGAERATEELAAVRAVRAALRHAGVTARPNNIVVQREPFNRRGQRAEAFAEGTRFGKHRLWHVEISFDDARTGPLLIGDGRFLGLGLMAPQAHLTRATSSDAVQPRTRAVLAAGGEDDVLGFRVTSGWNPATDPHAVVRALRGATMSLYQALSPGAALPTLVSGHAADGGPDLHRAHLGYAWDPASEALLVIPPHVAERRPLGAGEGQVLRRVRRALMDLRELRAGRSGCLRVEPVPVTLPTASRWVSTTPYAVNRHRRSESAHAAIREDLLQACAELGLPRPEVIVDEARSQPKRGLVGRARLAFATSVRGPIALGRTRFTGGGWFVPAT